MGDCSYKLSQLITQKFPRCNNCQTRFNIRDTVVVVAGNGVDYLDPELIDKDENTRFIKILDQTLIDNNDTGIVTEYGVEYSEAEIDNAIKEFKSGRNPYNIVPQYAESEYTTDLCKAIGGETTGILRGNKFIGIKMKEDYKGCYCEEDIIRVMDYVYKTAKELKKPIAIYFPFEINNCEYKGEFDEVTSSIRRINELKEAVVIMTVGTGTASKFTEIGEVLITAPYVESYKGIDLTAGRIDYNDFTTLIPILFSTREAIIISYDEFYRLSGIAAAGAIGTAASAAILEWALTKGNNPNIYLTEVRLKLIEASGSNYIFEEGYGPVDIIKLYSLLM